MEQTETTQRPLGTAYVQHPSKKNIICYRNIQRRKRALGNGFDKNEKFHRRVKDKIEEISQKAEKQELENRKIGNGTLTSK